MRYSSILTAALRSSSRTTRRPPSVIKPYNQEYRRTDNFQHQSATLFDMMNGEGQFKIPEKLRLEILSPKLRSFPHARHYYQSLYWIGLQALNTICTTYVQNGTTTPQQTCTPTNDYLDFSSAMYHSSELTSNESLDDFTALNNIEAGLIMPPELLSEQKRVQLCREALVLMIGAIYIFQGASATEKVVVKKMLEGRSGLLNLRKFS